MSLICVTFSVSAERGLIDGTAAERPKLAPPTNHVRWVSFMIGNIETVATIDQWLWVHRGLGKAVEWLLPWLPTQTSVSVQDVHTMTV